MEQLLHENKTFSNIDYTGQPLAKSEFADCSFNHCNFAKADISQHEFLDCVFTDCDLYLAVVENTGIKNIGFANCRLTGIDFSRCSNFLFSVSFENSTLDYCSFYKKKMKKAFFRHCSVKNADFTDADLSMASFEHCDLLNATFVNTILEKTDFRTAVHYAFDPERNKIRKAKFSQAGITGLLLKYDIEVEQ